MCHMDISLENVLMMEDVDSEAGFYPILADFGLVLNLSFDKDGAEQPFSTTMKRGKIPYMSPEMLQGMPFNGTSSDVFALGKCLISILTGTSRQLLGRRPFRALTMRV